MLPLPLPRKLVFHPTSLSVRQAHVGHEAAVMVLDGDMTFADFWPLFDGGSAGRTLSAAEARRLLRQLLRRGVVPAWQAQAEDAYAVGRVHDALGELRMAGVTAAALQKSEALGDWVALLQAYEYALEAGGWVDAADRQRLVVLQVAQGALPPSLRAIEKVEVLAGNELLGARLDVLRAFAAGGTPVHVHMPWDEERPQAFAWTEGLLHALETRGHPGMSIGFSPRHGRGALRPVVSALYTPTLPASGSHPVVVRCAPAGLRHAESVAGQVAAWRAAGIPAQAIAVVTPQAAMAVDVVRALQAADIGCAHRAQRSLSQSRIARLFFAGLRAEAGHASGAFWTELWESCGKPLQVGDARWSPDRVVRALRRAGLATERPWQAFVAGVKDAPAEATPALMRALPAPCASALAVALAEFFAPLTRMPGKGSWTALAPLWFAWMQALTRALGAVDEAGEVQDAHAAERALHAALQGEAEAVAILQQCMLDAAQGEAAGDDTWTRRQLADWLEAMCAEASYLAVPHDPQGVHVLRPEDAVGGRFDAVLFAGADMEAFPRPLPTNPYLPETARVEVNRLLGPRLLQYAPMLGRGALPAVARDMWLWLEVLATASAHLVVTLQEGIGEAMLGPSELVDELLRVSRVGMTQTSPDGCVDAVVPTAWVPRLWTASPQRFAACMAHVAPALGARLVRRCREASQRFGVARVPRAVAEQLQAYFEQTVHSASRMDVLGMCAFRYVAAAIWGLGTDEDIALGATPREQGSAAHAALHHVYGAIMHNGGMQQARQNPEVARQDAQQTMVAHAAAILAETQVHPLLQPALLQETAAATLAQLDRDLASPVGATPVALEYSFDDRHAAGPAALCVEHPTGGMRVQVRGSIDRVDVTDTDVWVLDYKRTVRARHPDRHFQLALYAAIALRDLRPEASQVRVGWAGLRPAKIHWASDLPSAPSDLLAHLRARLFARIDPVAAGRFTPDPDDPSTCERCDFRRLCRRDDGASEAAGASLATLEVTHGT